MQFVFHIMKTTNHCHSCMLYLTLARSSFMNVCMSDSSDVEQYSLQYNVFYSMSDRNDTDRRIFRTPILYL